MSTAQNLPATEASNENTTPAPQKKRKSRKRKLNMVVRVVPPGTLRPNPRNEFARLTPQERREGLLRSLAKALADAERKLAAQAARPPQPQAGGDMRGQTLHAFDLELCDHALGNVVQHLHPAGPGSVARCRRYAALLQDVLTDKLLLAHLLSRADQDADDEQVRLLLNDGELYKLELVSQDTDLDRAWEPYEALHQRHVETIGEVRDHLSRQAAEDWSDACGQFARRLGDGRVRLHEGIGVIRDWVGRLRGLLRSMGAVELLPAPEGKSPTPTVPVIVPSVPAVPVDPRYGDLTSAEVRDIEQMREAIRKHGNGNGAPPKALITAARIGNQRGRKALRWLERHEGYQGFGRPLKKPNATPP